MPPNAHEPEPHDHKWLREYTDLQLKGLEREIELQFKALAQELVLQAKEYERRLTELNHAHEQARVALTTYMRIDKIEPLIETIEEDVRDLQLYKANSEGRVAIIAAIAAGVVSIVIALILNFILK